MLTQLHWWIKGETSQRRINPMDNSTQKLDKSVTSLVLKVEFFHSNTCPFINYRLEIKLGPRKRVGFDTNSAKTQGSVRFSLFEVPPQNWHINMRQRQCFKTPPMLQPIAQNIHRARPALRYGGTLEEQN
jgi:hypothetical protein